MSRQTYLAKPGEVKAKWFIVDGSEQIVGRLAARIAPILQGKHKPQYTPHVDTGDYVIITNAEKVRMTGKKLEHRKKTSYSYYAGGLRVRTYGDVLAKHPERLVEDAVRRMLPKGRLGRKMYGKLKVYAGGEHPHSSQQPEALKV